MRIVESGKLLESADGVEERSEVAVAQLVDEGDEALDTFTATRAEEGLALLGQSYEDRTPVARVRLAAHEFESLEVRHQNGHRWLCHTFEDGQVAHPLDAESTQR